MCMDNPRRRNMERSSGMQSTIEQASTVMLCGCIPCPPGCIAERIHVGMHMHTNGDSHMLLMNNTGLQPHVPLHIGLCNIGLHNSKSIAECTAHNSGEM